jgi:hypothetical protein
MGPQSQAIHDTRWKTANTSDNLELDTKEEIIKYARWNLIKTKSAGSMKLYQKI